MARRGTYDNSYNRNKVRIDARPQNDPATQAGLRNVHRDMRGNVIGATTPEGYGIGTKSRSWQSPPSGGLPPMKSRLGSPSTPGLDRLAAMQNTSAPRESFAATEKRKRRKSAASGAFGQNKAQNLAQRQQLFADMKESGRGAQSPDMAKRAAGLGVTKSQYNRAWSKLPKAPAMMAMPGADSADKTDYTDYRMTSASPKKPRKWRAPLAI